MKKATIIIISLLTTLVSFSQSSAVTITIYGNKNLQLSIDSINQSLSDGASTDEETTIVLNDLNNGPHSLQVSRINLNTNRPDKVAAPFNLRNGFDILIKVNHNNSLEIIETKRSESSDVLVPMSTLNFNNLVKNVKAQVNAAGKRNVIANAFNNTNNAFTTSQARQLLTLVNNESFRLQLAKLSYRGITDKGNFYKLYDLLFNQNSVNELADYVYNYENSNNNLAMPESDFNILQQSILQQWPVSAQMNSLVNAFNNQNNYFTSYQASQLIQLVTAEGNRLQLAKLSYRSITDRGNFYQVFNLLNTQASKNELETYVNNYGGTTNVAMSEANFNALYQSIQGQWPVNAQMSSLTTAFTNPANFFTTSQAGRLIQLVTLEYNRLQLAKLSYRTITDRNNFIQIYDLLNTQASRNELQAYVNSYSDNEPKLPMIEADFNSLYQTIQNQPSVSTKMNSLISAFNNNAYNFTTYQAIRLIQLVSLESNRLQLAKLSYRSITDKPLFSQVYSLLNAQASKDELAAYINNYTGGNTPVKTPMADDEFNTLHKSITLKFFPLEKMNSLTELFTSTTSYFTTAQAKKLIGLVSLESNRLYLAKLSYRSISDRENFSNLYDLLSSQSKRTELDNYVKAYKD